MGCGTLRRKRRPTKKREEACVNDILRATILPRTESRGDRLADCQNDLPTTRKGQKTETQRGKKKQKGLKEKIGKITSSLKKKKKKLISRHKSLRIAAVTTIAS